MDGKQLKNSILQWAIQGKLVPQNPKDEPAQKLLERIAASRNAGDSRHSERSEESSKGSKKTSLRGAKATKQSKNPPSRIYCENGVWYEQVGTAAPKDISDEIPFEIPENWAWCRLGDLGLYRKGPFGSSLTKSMFVPKSDKAVKVYEQKNAIKKDYTLGDYYISPEKFNTMQSFIVRPNDIIVSCAGTIGETYMLPQDAPVGIINQALMRVCLYDLEIADYWQLFFEYILLKKAEMKGAGSAIKNIPPFEVLKSLLIALPPIQEQKRLLEKYRKVLKHVEEFDEAQEQLDKLNKELPEALKKSILQEAIQGKLVPQNPKDEPAHKLLEKIALSRHSERSEESSKRSKKTSKDQSSRIYRENGVWYEQVGSASPKDISDEIPFEIPGTWTWCRMGDIIEFVNGRAYKKEELLSKGKYKVLRVGNFFTNQSWYFSDLELPEDKYCYNGDLLYAWSASFGPQIWNGDKTIFHYHIWNLKYDTQNLYREYLYYFFLYDKNQIGASTTGSTMIHVSMEHMIPRLIPIPPLAEQKRIVKKIEELYKVIDSWK